MPAIPIVTAAAGIYGAVKGADQARKSANQANDAAKAAAAGTGGGTVNIADLQKQAQQVARENAANSAALEAQYNPGASQLRQGSLEAVMAALSAPRSATQTDLMSRIAGQAGQPLSRVGIPDAQQFDSALTRQAVEAAAADLRLGGQLPQDVRNLVAQRALERSGQVTGRLDLGRDLTTRDLGLTSLDLYNKRLANAASLGAQEAALGRDNASLRQQAAALGLTAEGMNLDSERFGRGNLFDSASFLQNIDNGDFSRALSAAQLGQNIAAPMSGLDPGAVANLAVGNSNVAANAAQQAAAMGVQAGNQKSALGGQLVGTGLGFIQDYLNRPKTATPAPSYNFTPSTTIAPVTNSYSPAYAAPYNPGFAYNNVGSYFK